MVNDDPWWVAKDVCEILGLSEVSKSVERLDNDEKLIRTFFVSDKTVIEKKFGRVAFETDLD